MRFGRLVPGAMLTLACLPGAAIAQPRPAPAPSPIGPAARAEGVEIAAGSMIVAIFPTVGGQVSIPANRRVRFEVGAHAMPWLLEDGEDFAVVTQLQARIPFRAGPPGSRRSLLLGVTSFTVADRLDSRGDWEFSGAVRPHTGVSWQWQKSPHVDVRIDLHGVFTGARSAFVVPFATFSMVWHRERRWS
jgi:hypothetical protein